LDLPDDPLDGALLADGGGVCVVVGGRAVGVRVVDRLVVVLFAARF
jgi:hypothetical protein